MKPKRAIVAASCLSFILVNLTNISMSHAQLQRCPEIRDQLVIVEQGQPTAFRLDVRGLGDGDVGVFQFPARGILEQTGPGPLDFVFLPAADFNGTTEFTYRVIQSVDCDRAGVQLGRVTLVGGTAAGTAIGLAPPPTFCGVGPIGLLMLGCCLVSLKSRIVTRPR